ncbi:hypothetical protein EPN29_06295 [bacterium]|nr:MAG: hypothetical protein EPN29_06295 [bacterium]
MIALAVKFNPLAVIVVMIEVDDLWVDEGEQLFVVPPAGVGHDLGDVAGALHRPFELLGELVLGGQAVKLAAQQQLGALVVGGGGDQQLRITHGGRLGRDGGIQVGADPLLGEAAEITLSTARE